MNILERAKGIILNPKNEWNTIQTEQTSPSVLLTGYLLPLALIPAIAGFIGYGLIGQNIAFVGHVGSVSLGIRYSIMLFINMIVGVYVSAFIIDYLAPNFSAVKNFSKAFQLAAYAYTPAMVAGILYILPSFSVLVLLASLYGLYLLYIGLKPMMVVPDDKVTNYFIVSLVVMIIVSIVLSALMTAIIVKPAFGIPGI